MVLAKIGFGVPSQGWMVVFLKGQGRNLTSDFDLESEVEIWSDHQVKVTW